ncbi:MAG TPA: hypothetical protein EYO73_11065 [Sulfurimonas sp.]|nr:hypothetical protein [Sulfurimonas sp.]
MLKNLRQLFLFLVVIVFVTACSKSEAQKEADKQREINANKREFIVQMKDGKEFIFKTPKRFFHSLKFDDEGYLVQAYVDFKSDKIPNYSGNEDFKVKIFMHKFTYEHHLGHLGYFSPDDVFSKKRGLYEQIDIEENVTKVYPQNTNWAYTLETYEWIRMKNKKNVHRLVLPNNEYVKYNHPFSTVYYFQTTVKNI